MKFRTISHTYHPTGLLRNVPPTLAILADVYVLPMDRQGDVVPQVGTDLPKHEEVQEEQEEDALKEDNPFLSRVVVFFCLNMFFLTRSLRKSLVLGIFL